MNLCTLMAEIISAPQLRYTQDNQTAITEMTIAFPGQRAEDPPQKLKVIGWGNLAQEVQEKYKTGDRVLIEGRLTINTVDRPEGFKEKQAELTAQRIHLLSDLGTVNIPQPAASPEPSTPVVAAAAAPSYPAAQSAPPPSPEAEVDYDDIPF
ncbi:single-stranded DNA-binding protein [Oscillatoria sp. CS-180]|uniref:single-stranded DNA-binding protein n=1 Tax=Oscillatoria sp. CS-180 TaxID=3021720 RepID=UPI00232CCA57|nr:single-stranded DNA-binding protein [Oscillatoria sp. CS-180]MDB9527777.1 single-stranded DNA-binding protein [Oscillatoria sp. CS-180]